MQNLEQCCAQCKSGGRIVVAALRSYYLGVELRQTRREIAPIRSAAAKRRNKFLKDCLLFGWRERARDKNRVLNFHATCTTNESTSATTTRAIIVGRFFRFVSFRFASSSKLRASGSGSSKLVLLCIVSRFAIRLALDDDDDACQKQTAAC